MKLVGIFDGTGRHEKIVKPLNRVGQEFDYKNMYGNGKLSRFADDFKVLIKLTSLSVNSVIKREKNKIITDAVGRRLLLCSIFSNLPRNEVYIRLKGEIFQEREEKLRKSCLKDKIWINIMNKTDTLSLKSAKKIFTVSKWLKNSIKSKINNKEIETLRTPQIKDIEITKDYKSRKNPKIITVTTNSFEKKLRGLTKFLQSQRKFINQSGIEVSVAGVNNSDIQLDTAKIHLLGYLDNIENIYKDYDIFVHFSYLDSVPSTVLEAQAAGLPVVVNDACGMPELVEDGVTGFIVDLDDEAEVKEKLSRLASDRELRKKFGKRGQDRVSKRNSLEKIGRDFAEAMDL